MDQERSILHTFRNPIVEALMPIPSFDIFRTQADGPVWRACAFTLEDAQSYIEAFAADTPGDYIILNQQTGNTVLINAQKSD